MRSNSAEPVAVILAGGLGTRLRPVLSAVPKVLAPVGGRPFIYWLLDQLVQAGLREVVLATGHMADAVRSVLGDHYGALRLRYSVETSPLGTGGALRAAAPLVHSADALVLNGDSYCDADLAGFLQAHRQRNSTASILLARVDDTGRYGRVTVDDGGRVVEFAEKVASGGPGWINAGIYVIRTALLWEIAPHRPVSIERDVFPAWIGRGLYGFPGAHSFIDIGTPESYRQAEQLLRRSPRRRFVILDRDGTLIFDRHYLSDPEQVALLPGAAEGLRRLAALGIGLIVITNQSGVARGYFDLARVEQVHQRLERLLAEQGVRLDAILVCPHKPDDDCACRKPKAGLLLDAAARFGFDPAECFVVGDKPCDIELGQNVGANTILVRTGYGAQFEAVGRRPDHVADDLLQAAAMIEQLLPPAS